MLDHVLRFAAIVGDKISNRGKARFITVADGSYNMIFQFRFLDDGSQVVLRVPKPGHTAASLVSERIANEANWMEYIREHTRIPIPRVYSWNAQGLEGIDPFILMDYVQGDNLFLYLRTLNKSQDVDDTKKRNFIYEQIADMYLQLYRLRFKSIGSIGAKTPDGQWTITKTSVDHGHAPARLGRPRLLDRQVAGRSTGALPRLHILCRRPAEAAAMDPAEPECADGFEGGHRRQGPADGRRDRLRSCNGSCWVPLPRPQGLRTACHHFVHNGDDKADDASVVFIPDLHPRNMLVDPETGASQL